MTRLAAALAVGVMLAACTSSPTPDPAPSASASASEVAIPSDGTAETIGVAVVIAPEPPMLAADTQIEAKRLGASAADTASVRVVAAARDDEIPDITRFLAGEGYDLVCALGPGSLSPVLATAVDLPSTRFCAAPVIADEVPANVLAFDLRIEEAAYLAGVAAATYAPATPPVLMTGAHAHAVARQQQFFRRGFAAANGAPDVAPIIIGPFDDHEQARAAVAEHLAGGASVVYSDAGPVDTAALAAAIAENERRATAAATPADDASEPGPPTRRAIVIGGPDLTQVEDGETIPPEVAYVVTTSWEVAVARALQAARGEWQAGVRSMGLLEGALTFEEGPNERLPVRVRSRVEDTRAGILDGRLVIGTGA